MYRFINFIIVTIVKEEDPLSLLIPNGEQISLSTLCLPHPFLHLPNLLICPCLIIFRSLSSSCSHYLKKSGPISTNPHPRYHPPYPVIAVCRSYIYIPNYLPPYPPLSGTYIFHFWYQCWFQYTPHPQCKSFHQVQ